MEKMAGFSLGCLIGCRDTLGTCTDPCKVAKYTLPNIEIGYTYPTIQLRSFMLLTARR